MPLEIFVVLQTIACFCRKIHLPLPSVATPIALYRPQIGPPARDGKKMAEKWILAPRGRRGENMAEKWENWPKLGQKWPFSIFWAIFFPFSGGAKLHFSATFFPISGRRPNWGSVQGNRDLPLPSALLAGNGVFFCLTEMR